MKIKHLNKNKMFISVDNGKEQKGHLKELSTILTRLKKGKKIKKKNIVIKISSLLLEVIDKFGMGSNYLSTVMYFILENPFLLSNYLE